MDTFQEGSQSLGEISTVTEFEDTQDGPKSKGSAEVQIAWRIQPLLLLDFVVLT